MRIAFRTEGDSIIKAWMLRTNDTVKKVRIREKKDSFTFEGGTYFIMKNRIMLYKGILGYKPFLFYKEGLAEPLSCDNIMITHNGKIVGSDSKEGQETILIDAQSIHNLTSRDLLSVLTKTPVIGWQIIIVILVIVSIIVSAVAVV